MWTSDGMDHERTRTPKRRSKHARPPRFVPTSSHSRRRSTTNVVIAPARGRNPPASVNNPGVGPSGPRPEAHAPPGFRPRPPPGSGPDWSRMGPRTERGRRLQGPREAARAEVEGGDRAVRGRVHEQRVPRCVPTERRPRRGPSVSRVRARMRAGRWRTNDVVGKRDTVARAHHEPPHRRQPLVHGHERIARVGRVDGHLDPSRRVQPPSRRVQPLSASPRGPSFARAGRRPHTCTDAASRLSWHWQTCASSPKTSKRSASRLCRPPHPHHACSAAPGQP